MSILEFKGSRLVSSQWAGYVAACQRGHLFFVMDNGAMGRVNRWYQARRLGQTPPPFAPSHIGVIGTARGAYESLWRRGPTRDYSVDRYLHGNRALAIGKIRHAYGLADVDRALARLVRHIQTYQPHYDWLSLVTLGRVQANNSMICSELVTVYVNELLRSNTQWALIAGDAMVLPWQWLEHVEIVWREGAA